MIAHRITYAQLAARITAQEPKWFTDAAAITARLPPTPVSSEFDAIWTDIKGIYIDLQHSKCCFCEKPLEGRIEQDVEHFRPKTVTKPWHVTKRMADLGIAPSHNGGPEPGYRLLAYHPFNYAMACKFCNSVLKRNFFPIAGIRNAAANDPAKLGPENAYLIYPIGDFDADPEGLITFDGLSPKPAVGVGFGMQRAAVVIELFRLDSVTKRPFLYKARAKLLRLLYLELRGLQTTRKQVERDVHNRAIAALTGDSCPFANCTRAFQHLFNADRSKADQYAIECLTYLESKALGSD